jgi:signal peptidase II
MKTDHVNSRVGGMIAAAVALAIDQFAKWFVTYPLELRNREVIDVLPIFSLRWAENHGVSMSLLQADGWFGRSALLAATSAIAAIVAIWIWRDRNRLNAMALGLILGGALGNIADRLRFGHVVDFLDLHFGDWRPFLIFNTADCLISIGVIVLLLRAWRYSDTTSRPQPQPS